MKFYDGGTEPDYREKDGGAEVSEARCEGYGAPGEPRTVPRYRIWYAHQVDSEATFEHEVPDPATGNLILEAIYRLALHQFGNNMIPDYANTGGIIYLDEDGEWVDYDEEDADA